MAVGPLHCKIWGHGQRVNTYEQVMSIEFNFQESMWSGFSLEIQVAGSTDEVLQ